MTSMIQSDQLRTTLYGVLVSNAAAGKTIPANATSTIFTIAGGRILITGLFGVVTTVVGGTTPPIKLIATPTTGTLNDMCTALTITAAEVGTQFALPAAVGSALIGTISKSGSVGIGGGQVAATGTIGVNCTAADATGAIRWSMLYVPLDNGASVTAA